MPNTNVGIETKKKVFDSHNLSKKSAVV